MASTPDPTPKEEVAEKKEGGNKRKADEIEFEIDDNEKRRKVDLNFEELGKKYDEERASFRAKYKNMKPIDVDLDKADNPENVIKIEILVEVPEESEELNKV